MPSPVPLSTKITLGGIAVFSITVIGSLVFGSPSCEKLERTIERLEAAGADSFEIFRVREKAREQRCEWARDGRP